MSTGGQMGSDGGEADASPPDAGGEDAAADSGSVDAGPPAPDAGPSEPDAAADSGSGEVTDSGPEQDAGANECRTRIAYGSAWIHADNHPENTDDVSGVVTWDGTCVTDSSGDSYAQLSNGWEPHFRGRSACVIAFDVRGSCAPTAGCSTRISYGSAWLHPDGHDESFDDVEGPVTTNGLCNPDGNRSYLTLSNGWKPYFTGQDSCEVAFRYDQCGSLFENPSLRADCPDPGVLQVGAQYVMACTSGRPEYPLRVSEDLVHWKSAGSIFSDANKPAWADRDFWAPELHHVGDKYLAYFSARHVDGDLAVGVATADEVLGPYEDSGAPLVRDSQGAIDAHEFEAPDGKHYLLWKVDGNASGMTTPIKLQPLAADGLSLTGSSTTLLTNSESWEGGVIEGPWLIFESGYYYLFYSGNVFSSADYGTGVARSTSITGPFEKAAGPILRSNDTWAGPGHGSVVRAPAGEWAFVFHAWPADRVGQSPPGREVLLTRIGWAEGWPTMLGAPSSISQPLP